MSWTFYYANHKVRKPKLGGALKFGTADDASSTIQYHEHSPTLSPDDGYDSIAICMSIFENDIKSSAYSYIYQHTNELLCTLKDLHTSGVYAGDCQAMMRSGP